MKKQLNEKSAQFYARYLMSKNRTKEAQKVLKPFIKK